MRIPTPPNSFTLDRLLFHNLSQRLELGDSPPCLPPGHPLPPLPPLVLSFSCPLIWGEEGAYVWKESFPLSTGACPCSGWGYGSSGKDKT